MFFKDIPVLIGKNFNKADLMMKSDLYEGKLMAVNSTIALIYFSAFSTNTQPGSNVKSLIHTP